MASRNVTLAFEGGVPVYSGEPELLDEYLDRVAAIRVGYTEDTAKKFGGLGARLYNALRGEAYTAVRGAKIPKEDLVKDEGLDRLLQVIAAGVRPAGPTRTGELFKEYFKEPGRRRPAESMNNWLIRRAAVLQDLLAADSTTKFSDNLEAFFLLEQCGLGLRERGQLLASTSNQYDPKTLQAAMRTQFGEVHLHERGYRPPMRRHAYAAEGYDEPEQDEFDEDSTTVREDDATDDQGGGEWTDLEDELARMQEEADAGRAVDEEMFVHMAETLEQEQVAYIARQELRQMQERRQRFGGGGDRTGKSGGRDADDRKKRIAASKRNTTCRRCHQKGHWAGDPECPMRDVPDRRPERSPDRRVLPERGQGGGRGQFGRGHARDAGGRFQRGSGPPRGGGSRGRGRGVSRFKTGYFAIAGGDEEEDAAGRPSPRDASCLMAVEEKAEKPTEAQSAVPVLQGAAAVAPRVVTPPRRPREEDMEVDSWTQVSQVAAASAAAEVAAASAAAEAGAQATGAAGSAGGAPKAECKGCPKACWEACNLEGCPCEGFGRCIGRAGHTSRTHRCTPVATSAAVVAPAAEAPMGARPRAAPRPEAAPVTSTQATVSRVQAPLAVKERSRFAKDAGVEAEELDKDPGPATGAYAVGDPRRCTREGCNKGAYTAGTWVRRTTNSFAHVWVCEKCDGRVAEFYRKASKKHDGKVYSCCMAVPAGAARRKASRRTRAGEVNDDLVARLDTMCTSTMHGDKWLERYGEVLRKEWGLEFHTEPCEVGYRFGGGERKVSTQRDTLPVGIAGVNGELSSHRIDNSPAPLLLSLGAQKALGMVLDLPNGTVTIRKLGIEDLPLVRTREGGLGIHIAHFAPGGHTTPEEGREPDEKDEISVYYADLDEDEDVVDSDDEASGASEEPDTDIEEAAAEEGEPEGAAVAVQPEVAGTQQDEYVESAEEAQHSEAVKTAESEGVYSRPSEQWDIPLEEVRRRTTTKGAGEELQHCCQAVMDDATEMWATLRGEVPEPKEEVTQAATAEKVPRAVARAKARLRPGQTFVKELFAGSLLLTYVASVCYGLPVSQPDDVIDGFDYRREENRAEVFAQLEADDPWLTALPFPCEAWGGWSRMQLAKGGVSERNATERRKEQRVLLEFVRAVAKHRLERGRLVLLENPWSSDGWEQKELEEVLTHPDMEFVRVDQCEFGLMDAESGLRHLKPTGLAGNGGVMMRRLSRRCSGQHPHERLEGSNAFGSRTRQAGQWPEELCRAVLEGAAEEFEARGAERSAFPAEVEQLESEAPRKRMRPKTPDVTMALGPAGTVIPWRGSMWVKVPHPSWRRGLLDPGPDTIDVALNKLTGKRVTIGVTDDGEAFETEDDLLSSPDMSEPAQAGSDSRYWRGDTYLEVVNTVAAGVPESPAQATEQRGVSPAAQATEMEAAVVREVDGQTPTPVDEEPGEGAQQAWKKVPADVRKELLKLHCRCGHPSNHALQRVLRAARAAPEVIAAAGTLWCSVCATTARPPSKRVARLPTTPYEFNYLVQIDCFEEYTCTGRRITFLNIICDGTTFQVCVPVRYGGGTPTGETLAQSLATRWISWAGWPQRLYADQARNNLAAVRTEAKANGVHVDFTALEQSHQLGRCEHHGGLWKEIWRRVVHEKSITSDADVEMACAEVNATKNSLARRGGFAPAQWVLGRDVRQVGANSDLSEATRLEVQEELLEPGTAWRKSVEIRTAARQAFMEVDADDRIRRAMLHNARPMRGPFPNGSYVYFYRKQRPEKGQAHAPGKWHGVCEVIGDRTPTHGSGRPQGSSIWLNYQGQVVQVSPEQLRFATPEELAAWRLLGEDSDLRHLAPVPTKGKRVTVVDARWTLGEDDPPRGAASAGAGVLMDAPERPMIEDATEEERREPQPPPPERTEEVVMELEPGADAAGEGAAPATPRGEQEDLPAVPADERVPAPKRPIEAAGAAGDPEAATISPARVRQRASREAATAGPSVGGGLTAEEAAAFCAFVRARCEQQVRTNGSKMSKFAGAAVRRVPEWKKALGKRLGKPGRRELKEKDLRPELLEDLERAKAKEWAAWTGYKSVDIIPPKEVQKLPRYIQAVPLRFVITDRNETQRTEERPLPVDLKARLVVLGNLERDAVFRRDAPTASLLAQHLVLAWAASGGGGPDGPKRQLEKLDAKNAYLQGDAIERDLYLRLPQGGLPGVAPGSLLKANVPIYGTGDAARGFWLKMQKVFAASGWTPSALEPALFYLWDPEGRLVGMAVTHVDDVLLCGEGEHYRRQVRKMKAEMEFDKESAKTFVYCGKQVRQSDDGTIELGQPDTAEQVKKIALTTQRRRDPDAKCTAEEISALRGRYGSLSWLQRQTRPDLSYASSKGQTAMSAPTVADILACNRAVEKAHERKDFVLRFRGGAIDWATAEVLCTTDASHAGEEDIVLNERSGDAATERLERESFRSQKGMVVMLSESREKGNGAGKTNVYPMEWKSQVEKRVCRSTLQAETYALATGTEATDWLRALLAETRNREFSVHRWEQEIAAIPCWWLVDAKSVQEHLGKDCGMPADKRLGIELASLRQLLRRGSGKCRVVWIDTTTQLADALTKDMDAGFLEQVFAENTYDTEAVQQAKDAKQRKATLRRERKAEKAEARKPQEMSSRRPTRQNRSE